MDKGKKTLVAAFAALALLLASCASKPTTPTTTLPEPTTTTTVAASVPETTTTTVAAVVPTTTTTVPAPSISEVELRNLYGQANLLRTDAVNNDIASVLPDKFASTDKDFSAIQTDYNAVIDAPAYDGVKAFPLKARLNDSIAAWTALNSEGMPLRADAERTNAVDMKAKANGIDAATLAKTRYDGAESFLAQGDKFVEGKDYSSAISSYKLATLAYDISYEKAKGNTLREKIFQNGYAKYSESYYQMAEDKFNKEDDYWKSGTYDDLSAGLASLKEANSYYEFVVAKGAEYKSYEGKDRATAAQDKALSIKADVNAADKYKSAVDILNEATDNENKGNFESALLWYNDAADAFYASYDASADLQSKDENAIASAKATLAASADKASGAGFADNIYIKAAQGYLDKAQSQYDAKTFSDSIMNANEAENYAGMSDQYVDDQVAAQEKAQQAQLAADKAAADPAMADAHARMKWADDNGIKADYPDVYKSASTSMNAADIAYSNERYTSAKSLAEQVSSTLSNDFEAKVAADRKAAADAIALKAEQKAAADAAMSDAQNRMAWANENNIKADYPDQYSSASKDMIASFTSYGNGDYVSATSSAKEVSSILSDDFEAQVVAERKAAAQLAADKAAADPAMADAHARMKWADDNGIKADYPDVYKSASTSMNAADIAYSNERYTSAKSLAEQVSSTLSDDFKAKVALDRKDALKAVADAAMSDAQVRMAWANDNNIKADYPDQYNSAYKAMTDAFVSYGNGDYPAATASAKQVSSILSDSFEAQVAAERKAAADKAAADAAAAKAAADKAAADAAAAKAAADKAAAELAAEVQAAQDAINSAQAKLDWAISKNAKNNYPELLAKGSSLLDSARSSFNNKDYKNALADAQSALDSLNGISEFAPLPAKYTVRLIPARRDCLWRIAEYSFVYNNPLKWPVLYNANKKTFRDPSNPNLIFPGQVLVIPSIKGETRDGFWDPNKTYQPLAK